MFIGLPIFGAGIRQRRPRRRAQIWRHGCPYSDGMKSIICWLDLGKPYACLWEGNAGSVRLVKKACGQTSPTHFFFVQADREHQDNVSVLPCSPREDKADLEKYNSPSAVVEKKKVVRKVKRDVAVKGEESETVEGIEESVVVKEEAVLAEDVN